jgi:hypothetical protein
MVFFHIFKHNWLYNILYLVLINHEKVGRPKKYDHNFLLAHYEIFYNLRSNFITIKRKSLL